MSTIYQLYFLGKSENLFRSLFNLIPLSQIVMAKSPMISIRVMKSSSGKKRGKGNNGNGGGRWRWKKQQQKKRKNKSVAEDKGKNSFPFRIPKTSFSCKQRAPGYYSDMEADCQVAELDFISKEGCLI